MISIFTLFVNFELQSFNKKNPKDKALLFEHVLIHLIHKYGLKSPDRQTDWYTIKILFSGQLFIRVKVFDKLNQTQA